MSTKKISDINRRTGKAAWLNADAAASYERMKAVGLPGKCVNDAGRTNAEQRALYNAWLKTGKTSPPSVAYPGTSLHEKGNALDLAEPARAWMHKFGKYYGWVNPAWAKRSGTYEPWHFEYDPRKDRSKHVKVKTTRTLTAATYRAISRAVARPRINRPSKPRLFWRHVQKQINQIMRGTKGWKPLKRDGLPGPKTWEGLRLSLRKTNKAPYRPGKNANQRRTIYCWQKGLNKGWWGRSIKEING